MSSLPPTQLEPLPPLLQAQAKIAELEAALNKPSLLKRVVEKIAGYKTVAFGSLVGVVGPLLDYVGALDLTNAGIAPLMAMAIGAIIVALRVMTKGPIFRGEG